MITFLLSDSNDLTLKLLTEECSEGFVFILNSLLIVTSCFLLHFIQIIPFWYIYPHPLCCLTFFIFHERKNIFYSLCYQYLLGFFLHYSEFIPFIPSLLTSTQICLDFAIFCYDFIVLVLVTLLVFLGVYGVSFGYAVSFSQSSVVFFFFFQDLIYLRERVCVSVCVCERG